MNKPATKEPSMDEILSSIRQIIADDDAAVAPKRPPVAAAAGAGPSSAAAPIAAMNMAPLPSFGRTAPAASEPEPLALRPDQMIAPSAPSAGGAVDFSDIAGEEDGPEADDAVTGEPQLVDPEDIAFDAEEEDATPYAAAAELLEEPEPEAPLAARPVPVPRLTPRADASAYSAPRPGPSASRAAPMPDPTLSHDIAEQLLEPATNAAVKQNFSRLSSVSAVASASNVTIESMIRDILRPMLKEWLDENLPAVVERMVEKEIARISRGE